MIRWPSGACLLLASLGCAELPEVRTGECGNAVVEAGEDCDTFGLSGVSAPCHGPDSPHACHLDCQPDSQGAQPSCPPGWGCDQDDVCRAPTGEFEAPVEYDVGGIDGLGVLDFDGDERDDIVSRSARDSYGRSSLRLHYFDQGAALVQTESFPKLVTQPALLDLTGDGHTDLVFSDFRVGVLQGRSDRRLVPETFSPYVVPNTSMRMLGVYNEGVETAGPLVLFGTIDGRHGMFIPDEGSGTLDPRGTLPLPVEALLADPAVGQVVEGTNSPCAELVLAMRGAKVFTLVEACTRDPKTFEVRWRSPFTQSEVAVEPEGTIDVAPQLVDFDGDGHLDVLLGVEGKPYVSYGDGAALSTAVPVTFKLFHADDSMPKGVPLIAFDLTGDGPADLIFPQRIMASVKNELSGETVYQTVYENVSAPWTLARFADLNGNGTLDLAAASSDGLNVTFLGGTDSKFPVPSILPTSGPVLHMATGDLDGDLIVDLSFIEPAQIEGERDSLMVAFGKNGVPELPTEVARVSHADQLSVYEERGIGNIILASHQGEPAREGGPPLSSTITLLDGSTDRIPYAPFRLVSFTSDGRLEGSVAVGLAVGAFRKAGELDVMALGTEDPARGFNFWLVPRIAQNQDTPLRLGRPLEKPLEAFSMLTSEVVKLHVMATAADFDGDGLDEALWALPANGLTRCGLLLFDVSREGAPKLEVRAKFFLDEPCERPQLAAVDADEDDRRDIVLLTGSGSTTANKLMVLWNDGQGGFAPERSTVVSDAQDSPLSFAVLPATTVHTFGFAYVTDTSVARVHATSAREFGMRQRVLELRHGTGIVAGNFDGDGVIDLCVADTGNLHMLRGELRAP